MPFGGRAVDRREPTLHLHMDVTSRNNQLVRDASMSIFGRDVER
jgi:hypothetical protein